MPQALTDAFVKKLIKWSVEKSDAPRYHKHHITRFAMYRALRDRFKPMCDDGSTVLSISKSITLCDILGLSGAQIVNTTYPEVNILDLSAFSDESFDFTVSDQVLEHVEGNPFDAVKEAVRPLAPGGWTCHTTCFFNQGHGSPKDFWRFTTDALALMAREAGLVDIQVDGWGNRDAWALIDLGLRRMQIPDDPEHPIYQLATESDSHYHLVVWLVARKPLPTAKLRKRA